MNELLSRLSTQIGICALVALCLLAAKGTGLVSWPWWVILAPVWIPVVVVIGCCALIFFAYATNRR